MGEEGNKDRGVGNKRGINYYINNNKTYCIP